MHEEVILTTIEVMGTYGFWKLISILWTPVIVIFAIIIIKRRSKGDVDVNEMV